jgi:hypothetical protein
VVVKRRKRLNVAENPSHVDWQAYYASIKRVCPWSYRSYMANKILTLTYSSRDFSTWGKFLKYTGYDSVVYVCEDRDSAWLDAKCDELNAQQETYQWLWSHPAEGGDSTPVPVLIQQERALLEGLRQKTGYYNNEAE